MLRCDARHPICRCTGQTGDPSLRVCQKWTLGSSPLFGKQQRRLESQAPIGPAIGTIGIRARPNLKGHRLPADPRSQAWVTVALIGTVACDVSQFMVVSVFIEYVVAVFVV